MNKLSILALIIVFLSINTVLNAQSGIALYDDRQYLIRFDEGTTQPEIEIVLQEMQSHEIWVSPLTQTRKWELNNDVDFPYYNAAIGAMVLDINEQRDGASSRAKVDEADLNFFYTVDPTGSGGSGNAQNYCYDGISNNVNNENILTIAILDTGFGGSTYGVSPTNAWNYVNSSDDVNDNNGHGRHIFSIIESTFVDNTGFHPNNINWDIRKTHDSNGVAELANIILALEEAVNDGADIINMSTSFYDEENIEQQTMVENVIEVIEQNNVLIVASAGNEASELDLGHEPNCFPSEFPTYNLLTVAAYDCDTDALATYSNYGTFSIDIAAPGTNILGYGDKNFNLVFKSGTSQATAIVTGVAASLGINQTNFDYIEVKCAILSGVDVNNNLNDKVLTSGFLNAQKALELLTQGCTDIIDQPNPNLIKRQATTTIGREAVIYPNPSNSQITLLFENEQPILNVKVVDIKGQVVIRKQFSEVQSVNLDISEISKGMYFIQYETSKDITNDTFIKN